MDVVRLSGIRAMGRHGANPGERDRAQPFDIDVALDVDLSRAQKSDDLSDTIDYGVLHERLRATVESTSFLLLERLAGELLTVVLADARVAGAEISIAKPALLAGATPSVTLRRANPRFRDVS